ncbi:MAG: ABC transporter substrate binding protein [Variovorax sp.]
MPANRFPSSLLVVLALRAMPAFVCTALLLCGAASATALTVLSADESEAHAEFIRLLRAPQDPAGSSVRVDALTLAVGVGAARTAIERPGRDPLLLAMLSRLDFESLRASPALRRGDRPVGVLLREPAMADQLALIDAILPNKRRLGVVATAASAPIVRELQRAAEDWNLQIEYAPDAQSISSALRLLMPRCDALMVLPDLIGDSQAATLAVLRAAAGAGLPVFGTSEGVVRSGGLAAAVSTPAQLATQARTLGQKLAAAPPVSRLLVEAAAPAAVRVNTTVARGLGLRLPGEQELAQRIAAVR